MKQSGCENKKSWPNLKYSPGREKENREILVRLVGSPAEV
jgi:hypothetical protein